MPEHYRYVGEYLAWCRHCLAHFLLTDGKGIVRGIWPAEYTERQWHREFLRALHRRINAKGNLFAARTVAQLSVYHGNGKGKVWSLGGNCLQSDAYSYIGPRNLADDADQVKRTRYRVWWETHGVARMRPGLY